MKLLFLIFFGLIIMATAGKQKSGTQFVKRINLDECLMCVENCYCEAGKSYCRPVYNIVPCVQRRRFNLDSLKAKFYQ
uniref:Uncharacterized protein n=1 Tax=Panagrellus redivivus TaxID=6233 RepID=A0A7E4ZXH5_PANRE